MESSRPGRIVVGIGRSLGGYQALRFAVAEARRRETTILAVRTFLSAHGAQGVLSADHMATAAVDHVKLAFTEALGGIPWDVGIEILAQEGTPAHMLVSIACRESDMLVIGGCGVRRWTHRRSTIARFCVRHATCPVVVVPPTALARSGRADRLAHDTARDAADYLDSQIARRRDPA